MYLLTHSLSVTDGDVCCVKEVLSVSDEHEVESSDQDDDDDYEILLSSSSDSEAEEESADDAEVKCEAVSESSEDLAAVVSDMSLCAGTDADQVDSIVINDDSSDEDEQRHSAAEAGWLNQYTTSDLSTSANHTVAAVCLHEADINDLVTLAQGGMMSLVWCCKP